MFVEDARIQTIQCMRAAEMSDPDLCLRMAGRLHAQAALAKGI
jgi:hypothetical protein